ncbi:hypothetical protein [Flavobacterium facile]|uniref:hypothetical protein n=1 Tax=Flavobacterium facile TaxID=2893174 RepID=UPI002E7742D9|nr:hypothetical protein [Flavobacterium sp. T-12]
MKKLIIVATLLFSLQNFAQKTFEVYNYTGQTVKLWDIITKPNSSATYPEFHSKPYGAVTIPPGGSYTLVNTANVFKFPFQSPTSIPYINNWERLNSASSVTPLASTVSWSLGSSNAQVFKSIIFEVGTSWNNLTVPIGTQTIPSAVTGSGWQLDYDCYQPDPAQPNLWYYTIVIY